MQQIPNKALKATELVRNAGGEVVGRTRLQKMAYLLEAAGLGSGFEFDYYNFGPYSEYLTDALHLARLFDLVTEEERTANWGGVYSVYKASDATVASGARKRIIELAKETNSVTLELAATALFLSRAGVTNPWEETERRKPDKKDYVSKAQTFYHKLESIECPNRFEAFD